MLLIINYRIELNSLSFNWNLKYNLLMSKLVYDHKSVEDKWSRYWVDQRTFSSVEGKAKKSYLLIEFPYPSGERLHVGHGRSYSCLDTVARKRRMQGENVMFPFGWDAFGLPAENYAIKTGVHPSITTKKNIANSRKQAMSWGLSFDWSREIDTTDPKYYKWTQWIFLQLFKNGLAYKSEIPVNWCPKDKINLANEEVIDGKCERCGTATERRNQNQWLLRITQYADRLLSDLDTVSYREDIKQQQINWIGKKDGIEITYEVEGLKDEKIVVFTTRPDTSFGVTFIVVSPEHHVVEKLLSERSTVDAKTKKAMSEYIAKSKNKSERERLIDAQEKSGVFTGVYAINNLNNEKIPVWISDYVLSTVGTGAVMGVPGHDLRDFQFAKAKGISIKRVVVGSDGDVSEIAEAGQVQEEEGRMINSGFLDGMDIHQATAKMMGFLEEKGWGKRVSTYHLRDWVFSRQHYWGEPIPLVYCKECARKGESWFDSEEGKEHAKNLKFEIRNLKLDSSWAYGWFPVAQSQLPVKLPEVEKYQPTETGESPLAHINEWVNTTCPNCGGKAKRETDTMPNWAGSSWYYLRYCDPLNGEEFANKEKLNYWLPVDWYNGGMEHTTLHLLYSRFWHKFLYDLGVVPTPEPYAKRTSHGVVLGPDGRRMSKSRGNVINPDEIVAKYGADTLRLYEMFIGPFDQMVTWNDAAVAGVRRFVSRIWDLSFGVIRDGRLGSSMVVRREMDRLILRVGNDIENMKFNTAVAACMEFVNLWESDASGVGADVLGDFIKVLAPMAPFVTEEIWEEMTKAKSSKSSLQYKSVHLESWPDVKETKFDDEILEIVVQVNGKLREKMPITRAECNEVEVKQRVLASAKVAPWIAGQTIGKFVWVPEKLINLVLEK